MIKNILIATDGSKLAGSAVTFAAAMAKQLKASVTIVGVVDLTSLIAPDLAPPAVAKAKVVMETQDLLKQVIGEHVERAARECRKKGLRTVTAVRTGRTVEEIVKEARKSKADLIVLGSHGRSALKAVVLGSVAYGVIHRNTRIPVLAVQQ